MLKDKIVIAVRREPDVKSQTGESYPVQGSCKEHRLTMMQEYLSK